MLLILMEIGICTQINSIYLCRPRFFLKAIYRSPDRDEIYRLILYLNYEGELSWNREMPDQAQIKKYGKYSDRLLRMYDYYRKNPGVWDSGEIPPLENPSHRD
jgi:hypothetical protein